MKLEMLASSSFEIGMMVFFIMVGMGLLLFGKKEGGILIGVLILSGVVLVAYSNHIKYMGERFIMEQFHEGRALECGMWRGESTKVDPLNGWEYEKDAGFVKGDVIINDPLVCSVIGKAFPEPSTIPYWMVLVSVVGILMMIRFALKRPENKHYETDENKNGEKEEVNNASDPDPNG